jgi:cytochrome c oxidase cbb3-type subunit 2
MLNKHQKLERNSVIFLLFIIVAVSVGGLVQIVPMFRTEQGVEKVEGIRPYTPLELAGYNIYIREGCNTCHSQQVRVLRDEVERYGHYSLMAESKYDHPFVWGSKRTGPDLARIGGKYSDEWHAAHLKNPRDVVPESIMPTYKFLANRGVDANDIKDHLKVLRLEGVPYTNEQIEQAYNDLMLQAQKDGDATELGKRYSKVNVRDFDGNPAFTSELDALIAYLQVVGTMADFKTYKAEHNRK